MATSKDTALSQSGFSATRPRDQGELGAPRIPAPDLDKITAEVDFSRSSALSGNTLVSRDNDKPPDPIAKSTRGSFKARFQKSLKKISVDRHAVSQSIRDLWDFYSDILRDSTVLRRRDRALIIFDHISASADPILAFGREKLRGTAMAKTLRQLYASTGKPSKEVVSPVKIAPSLNVDSLSLPPRLSFNPRMGVPTMEDICEGTRSSKLGPLSPIELDGASAECLREGSTRRRRIPKSIVGGNGKEIPGLTQRGNKSTSESKSSSSRVSQNGERSYIRKLISLGKRRADRADEEQGRDEDGDEEQGRKQEASNIDQTVIKKLRLPRYLACPYFKGDPKLYIGCALHASPDLNRLKTDHLKRYHFKSYECRKCNRWFGSSTLLREHQTPKSNRDCASRKQPKQAMPALPIAAQEGKTWEAVFRGLFPSWERDLPSPYTSFERFLEYEDEYPQLIADARKILLLCELERARFLRWVSDTIFGVNGCMAAFQGDDALCDYEAWLQKSMDHVSEAERELFNPNSPISGLPLSLFYSAVVRSDDTVRKISVDLATAVDNQRHSVHEEDSSTTNSDEQSNQDSGLEIDSMSASSASAERHINRNEPEPPSPKLKVIIKPCPILNVNFAREFFVAENTTESWETLQSCLSEHYIDILTSGDYRGLSYKSPKGDIYDVSTPPGLGPAISISFKSGESAMELEFNTEPFPNYPSWEQIFGPTEEDGSGELEEEFGSTLFEDLDMSYIDANWEL